MSTPSFSVVIPTHNRSHLLYRAIQSVLNQSFTDFELIVVDDASTDDTAEKMHLFSDPRLIYIQRERNGSAAAARNTGIQAARSELIAFLDDDDEFLPDFLSISWAAWQVAAPSVGLSWCGIRTIEETSTNQQTSREFIWQPQFCDQEHTYLSFLVSRRVGTNCGIILRRDCLETVGIFDEMLTKAEDTDFLIRFVRHYEFMVVPSVLVKIYKHQQPRLTIYDCAMATAYERIISKHQDTLAEHPEIASALFYKIGWLYYHGGDKSSARHFMKQARSADPYNIKLWSNWLILELFGSVGQKAHRCISNWKKTLPI